MRFRMIKANKLEEKYGITVINTPMDYSISEYCICGHHASEHKGKGTAGKCTECFESSLIVHNFQPRSINN